MKKLYRKTDNPNRKAVRAAFIWNSNVFSSRSGLLFRLSCAALALLFAVSGVSLLRGSFDVALPLVHGADDHEGDPDLHVLLTSGEVWEADNDIPHGADSITLSKIDCLAHVGSEKGGVFIVNEGKTVHMIHEYSNSGNTDFSEIMLNNGAELHLMGTMEGGVKELKIKKGSSTVKPAHFYVYLYKGAVLNLSYTDGYYDNALHIKGNDLECLGCNVGTNIPSYNDSETIKVWDESVTPRVQINIASTEFDDQIIGTFGTYPDAPTGTEYKYTAAPVEGYSRVVWLLGGSDGYVLRPSDQGTYENTATNHNIMTISCRENVLGQVYAKYVPDPTWTWDLESNPPTATCTVTEVDPDEPGGITETEYTDEHPSAVITAPTCTEDGYTTYTASVTVEGYSEPFTDTYVVTNTGTALGHEWGDWFDVTIEPTCTESGLGSHTCTRCGATETDVEIPAGHLWGEWSVIEEPTCTNTGIGAHTCTRCGATKDNDVIPALGHDWSEWGVTKEPTCTEKGNRQRTCGRCDEVENEELAALGHDWSEWGVTKEPTCTETGNRQRTCGRCHEVENEELAALGHDLRDDWVITEQPTQTETGKKRRSCHRNGCDYYEEEVIPALGGDDTGDHSKDYEFTAQSVWNWTKGSTSDMPVTLKNTVGDDTKTFGKLQKVSVDGTVIYEKEVISADGKFTATPGSINFMFHPDYLKTLSKGEHTLKVELTDGELEHTFTIAESGSNNTDNNNTNNSSDPGKGDSPETADNNIMLFLAVWLFIASVGIIVMLLFQKKKERYYHR